MEDVYFFLLYCAAVLFIPVVIVGLWRKRPVLSFLLAAIIVFITLSAIMYYSFQGPSAAFSDKPPSFSPRIMKRSLVYSAYSLVIFLPILFLFQGLIRYRYKKKISKRDMKKTFS